MKLLLCASQQTAHSKVASAGEARAKWFWFYLYEKIMAVISMQIQ
jgi:hypothetical protein